MNLFNFLGFEKVDHDEEIGNPDEDTYSERAIDVPNEMRKERKPGSYRSIILDHADV